VVHSEERWPVTIVVPTLDEEDRIPACLDALRHVRNSVARIIVSDGGSRDRTREIVRNAHGFELVAADPIPNGANGKAWGLEHVRSRLEGSTWMLIIDADVIVTKPLVASLVTHAESNSLDLLSVATRQQLDTPGLALLHPSMLATLVVRYGIPGSIFRQANAVQANGQCMLIRSDALEAVGGFRSVLGSVVEDVSIGRRIAALGGRVGFFEIEDGHPLVSTVMYGSASEAWKSWTRSLPVRDSKSGLDWCLRMADVVGVQGLWLPLAIVTRFRGASGAIALCATIVRWGTGLGLLRAYTRFQWPMVLSPLLDAAVVANILRQSFRRTHVWRGRIVRTGSGGPA
jgi:dolichol-phosphate mannosyltransferase